MYDDRTLITCGCLVCRVSGNPNADPSFFSSSRPGWTGLTALSSFIIIGLTSIPWFRKKFYEVFQLAHLLMYREPECRESAIRRCT